MPNLRALVQLQVVSGIAEDRPQNTLHFQTAVATTPYADIQTAIATFYNAIRGELSSLIAQNGHRTRIYDLADPEPRAPVHDVTWNFAGAVGTNTLPSEVALVLSFQGVRASGQSQARRRGRIYIGPLRVSAADALTGRPTTPMITTLTGAASALLASSDAAADWSWVVRSETNNDNTFIDNGWVDNSFDTQRRRGLAPSARTNWT